MKVKDIISLVKAGYSPQEIGALKEDAPTIIEMVNSGINKDDIPTLLEIAKTVEAVQKEEAEAKEESDENAIDYKAEYEKLLKEKQINKTKEEVEENKTKTADEILAEVAQNYF